MITCPEPGAWGRRRAPRFLRGGTPRHSRAAALSRSKFDETRSLFTLILRFRVGPREVRVARHCTRARDRELWLSSPRSRKGFASIEKKKTGEGLIVSACLPDCISSEGVSRPINTRARRADHQ